MNNAVSVVVYCNVKVEHSTYNVLEGIYQGCDSCLMASLTFANPLPAVIDGNTICSLGRMMQLDPV